jgi:hypothetical protein
VLGAPVSTRARRARAASGGSCRALGVDRDLLVRDRRSAVRLSRDALATDARRDRPPRLRRAHGLRPGDRRAADLGGRAGFRNVATRVRYYADGISHFALLADNARISWLHTRLVAGMLPRLQRLLARCALVTRAAAWLRRAEVGSTAGMRVTVWFYRHLGRRVARALLVPIVAYFWATGAGARDASRAYPGARRRGSRRRRAARRPREPVPPLPRVRALDPRPRRLLARPARDFELACAAAEHLDRVAREGAARSCSARTSVASTRCA